MKKLLFLLLVFTFMLSDIFAAQWIYVSPKGNDRNIGTKDQPLASLEGARDRVRQLRERNQVTDTAFVYVLPGDYYMNEPLRLIPKDGGTMQSPVVYTAGPNARPVFYGGMKLGKFEVVNDKLWRVFIPEVARYGFSFEQLYVNGERRFRAQTPNHGEFYRVKNVKETALDTTESQTLPLTSKKLKLHPSGAGMLDNLKQGGQDDALITIYQNWSETRQRILSVNRTDTALYIVGRAMSKYLPIDSRSRYFIENYREALDAPGEWFLSRDGYLYYIPCEGETIENTECMAPVTGKFVVIEGETIEKQVENIHFENLCFRVAGYRTPVQGNEVGENARYIGATIMLDFAKHIEFRNCEVANTGLYAIWFRRACSESLVQRCHLHDLGSGGVRIGEIEILPDSAETTSYITVDNNIIQHGGYVFPDGRGVIILHGKDNIITHNDIADFRYTGVSVGWGVGYIFTPSKRNKIEYNHIHHLGWGELSDMGGVYALGLSEGTTVRNNVIHHIYSFDYGGWGLYTDVGGSYIVLENNLVYNCKDAGFHQHYGKENIIRNNIFAFNVRSQIGLSLPESHRSLSFIYNIIYSDNGILYSDSYVKNSWMKAITYLDYNCYWDIRNPHPDFFAIGFGGWKNTGKDPFAKTSTNVPSTMGFREWQKSGKDLHSIIADPLFVDAKNLDFQFKSLKVAKKIGFKPFDYTRAGVYGSEEWKNLAKLDTGLMQKFDEAVVRNNYKGQ